MSLAALGLPHTATEKDVKRRYRVLAMKAHPDRGGSTEDFQRLQAQYRQALKEVGTPEAARPKTQAEAFEEFMARDWKNQHQQDANQYQQAAWFAQFFNETPPPPKATKQCPQCLGFGHCFVGHSFTGGVKMACLVCGGSGQVVK